MAKPELENPHEEALWEHGRDYERERFIEAMQFELLNPNYDTPEYHQYRLGLRMAIEIAKKLRFLDE